ncbi:PKS-NRPS hybrid synthetase cheA-like [Rhododendron vialii]|uniref:PKS-NRPS hybrid synthetase cheA-like n=1 Tax=Rhododendron vialii TaxID=182163 RepID=UPI00265F8D39|nr:PKS-NRPS hybrid synthetase cheA-like [Rhododendron vialii]
MQRITGTKKCDCPFKLRGVPQPPNGVMWSLKVVKGFHNHEPAEGFEGHEYPSRLTPIQQQLVRDMSSSTAPREILNLLRQQDSSISTGIRSIYNVKAQYKKEQLGDLSPIGYILNELNEKHYIYNYLTNEHTNEITDILWIHPTSLELSVNFPSVLIIDATYKSNEYRIPLLEVVGITSTMKTYSLMFAYLNNETKERLIWALDTLKRWMVGKGAALPSVIVSDRDLALLGAIEICFPLAQHILCIWHINQCVMKKCSPMLGTRWDEFSEAWQLLIHSSTPMSLQQRWNAMCGNFEQYSNAIQYLWDIWLGPYKERFVAAYINQFMHLGSNSSQRAESAHARLKRYLGDTMSSLQTSFQKIEKMLTSQFKDIQGSFQKSLNIPRHIHLHEGIYSEIRGRISLQAMDLIHKQAQRTDNEAGLCFCKIKRTHGLPCFHDIALYRSVDRPIPLSSIHSHWSTLSMHAQRHTDEGARSDRAAQLIERLNEMDSDSRDSMMDKFLDMADPSRCTVRPPAYNTEHRGRPTGRDEQNRGHIPSFTVSTSESRTSRIPTSRRSNGRDHLVDKFPQQYRRYISHCVDVRPDGHCGFRALAAQLYGSEDEWAQVRHDLIQEIEQNWVLYDQLYPERNYVSQVLQRLRCFQPSAPEDHWMDSISLGLVIASTYNVVLHTFDMIASSCFTHLPLSSHPVPLAARTHIAIGRVNGNHFVQIFLYRHYPVPPIIIWWRPNASNEAHGWAHPYEARLQLWYEVMQIDPPGQRPQFGGNID